MQLSFVAATFGVGVKDPRANSGPDHLRRQSLSVLVAKRLGMTEPPPWAYVRPLDEPGLSIEVLKAHYLRQLETQCRKELNLGRLPVIISSDHFCAQSTLGAAAKKSQATSKTFGAIWMNPHVDAHFFKAQTPLGQAYAPSLEYLLTRPGSGTNAGHSGNSGTSSGNSASGAGNSGSGSRNLGHSGLLELGRAGESAAELIGGGNRQSTSSSSDFTFSSSRPGGLHKPAKALIESGRLCVFGGASQMEKQAHEQLLQKGVKVFANENIASTGIAPTMQDAIRYLSRAENIAISIDLSVLNHAETPLTTPVSGSYQGIDFLELISAARSCARRLKEPYTLIDLSGYNPAINPDFAAGEAISELIVALLGY